MTEIESPDSSGRFKLIKISKEFWHSLVLSTMTLIHVTQSEVIATTNHFELTEHLTFS